MVYLAGMSAVIRFIPNLLTLANLALGVLALVFAAREEMVWSVYMIAIALVVDFLDGFVARLLHASSALGRELDSLADMVTFGVVPGFMLFQLIAITKGLYFTEIATWTSGDLIACLPALAVPLAAALRLGIFNLDTQKRDHFLGMPTPAMTIFVASIPLILEVNYHLNFYHPLSGQFIELLAKERGWDPSDAWLLKMAMRPVFAQVLSLALAVLMLVRIPMLSLKFKGLGWRANKWRYLLLIWAVVSYIIFVIPYLWNLPFSYGLIDYLIIPIFMLGYFALSLIYATFGAFKKQVESP